MNQVKRKSAGLRSSACSTVRTVRQHLRLPTDGLREEGTERERAGGPYGLRTLYCSTVAYRVRGNTPRGSGRRMALSRMWIYSLPIFPPQGGGRESKSISLGNRPSSQKRRLIQFEMRRAEESVELRERCYGVGLPRDCRYTKTRCKFAMQEGIGSRLRKENPFDVNLGPSMHCIGRQPALVCVLDRYVPVPFSNTHKGYK